MSQTLRQTTHRASRVMRRVLTPIGPNKLRAVLASVMSGRPKILFVHSSLSSCGYFVGGPEKVIEVLREFSDTLCLPTHTYSYPAEPDRVGPVFDPARTPSQMGLLAETFRQQPGVVRSLHATHSLAAIGPLAEEICAGHYRCDSPCGAGTPYERLVRQHASVLMLGVSFGYYTLFHTAEGLSESPSAYERDELHRLRVIDEHDRIVEGLSKRQGRAVPRFHEAGELLEEAGLVRRARLGMSHLLYVPDCSVAHDFLVERLSAIPDFLRAHCTEPLR